MAIDSERHRLLQDALKRAGRDAFLCSSPTEVLLLSGYWPVVGPSFALLTADGELRVVLPEDEVELAQATSSAHLHPFKPDGLHTLTPPMQLVEGALRDATQGLGSAKLGLQTKQGVQPSTYAVMTVFRDSFLGLLQRLLPAATLSSCDDLLEEIKATKTPRELALLKAAAEVAGDGFRKAPDCIRAGLRETEVAAAIQAAFETSSKAIQFQRSYGYFFCMSGPNSARAAAAYARTRQRVLEEGDLVMIHANTCADGYWTDLTRTFTVGAPSQRHIEIKAAITEARAAGLAAIRPGARAAAVDHAARTVMKAHGLGEAFKHAAGHGVGFAAANPNGRPRIHPESPDVLTEGMTFNLEPAAYFEGYGGMRHCDVVAVGVNGADVLTNC